MKTINCSILNDKTENDKKKRLRISLALGLFKSLVQKVWPESEPAINISEGTGRVEISEDHEVVKGKLLKSEFKKIDKFVNDTNGHSITSFKNISGLVIHLYATNKNPVLEVDGYDYEKLKEGSQTTNDRRSH